MTAAVERRTAAHYRGVMARRKRLHSPTVGGPSRLTNRADPAEDRRESIRWTIGAMGVQTVVIITAVIALARSLLH
jgi:hypothetical protein